VLRSIYTSMFPMFFSGIDPAADMVRGKDVDTGKHPDRECSDWRVGPEFIGTDRLVLVALDNVSKGSWQPRVGLLPTW
jgi:hypothetical protein